MNAIAASPAPTRTESGHSDGMRIGILVALVGAIIATHYLISRETLFYHDLLRRSMYVPIVLSAFWFSTKGGVATALVAGFLYAPHLFLQHELSGEQELDRAAEMLLYVLIGGLTGLLVERHDFQRLETEGALRRLASAHGDLREQAGRLLALQEELGRAERLSTLGEMAADIAHEVRNPLATIRGTVQILATNPPEDRRQEFAKIVIDEIDRLNRVVDGYLQSVRVPPRPTDTCDACAVLESVIALTRPQADRSGVSIRRAGIESLSIPLDAAQAGQVFMNLVLNAIQAMPDGGTLRIACARVPGPVAGTEWAEIDFADTGPGIPEEHREKVFRPLFTTRVLGSGLGLAIARRVLEAYGGTLALDSETSAGTTMRVRLPMERL